MMRTAEVPARLVLIEGMVGAGKTSTAAHLAARLLASGKDARAYTEFAADHPIRIKAVDLLRANAPGECTPAADTGADGLARDPTAYAIEQWGDLARQCQRADRTVILESSFLQNSVMPSFIDGAPIENVRAVFASIDAHIAPADPLLVYLRPSDTVRAVQRVHDERGEPWSSRNLAYVSNCGWARARSLSGQAAVVALYRAWEPVVDELLDMYSSPKLLLIDPQNDWDGTLQQVYRHACGEEPAVRSRHG